MPGPVPMREEMLNRSRSRKGGDAQPVTKGLARETFVPDANPEWHDIAIQLYDSLARSGQSDYYQQSDWAYAYSVCDDLSYYKSAAKRSGQMLQSIYAAMTNLLVTEADRRRVRIELGEESPEVDLASVAIIGDYKSQLGIAT